RAKRWAPGTADAEWHNLRDAQILLQWKRIDPPKRRQIDVRVAVTEHKQASGLLLFARGVGGERQRYKAKLDGKYAPRAGRTRGTHDIAQVYRPWTTPRTASSSSRTR